MRFILFGLAVVVQVALGLAEEGPVLSTMPLFTWGKSRVTLGSDTTGDKILRQPPDVSSVSPGLRVRGPRCGHVGSHCPELGAAGIPLGAPSIASNGKQDVIVVQFPEGADLATVDAEIASAEKAVTAVTNGAHAGMVASSLAPSTVSATNLAAEFNYRDSRTGVYYGTPSAFAPTSTGLTKTAPSNGLVGAANNQAGKALTYGPSRFLTPTLNLGILVTLYMLFVAISAFCCILSLQTPEMFEEDQKKAMHSALNPHN